MGSFFGLLHQISSIFNFHRWKNDDDDNDDDGDNGDDNNDDDDNDNSDDYSDDDDDDQIVAAETVSWELKPIQSLAALNVRFFIYL